MEPMTLGSPTNSPSTEQFLPAFLLGENFSNTPKRNKLSPEQDRRFNFGNVSSQTSLSVSMNNEIDRQAKPMPNSTKFGPPIIDLYDDMPSAYKIENDAFTPQSLLKKEDTSTQQYNSNGDIYNNSAYRSPLSSSRSYQFNTDVSNNSNMGYRSPYTSPNITTDPYRSPQMSYGFKRHNSFVNDTSMYHTPSPSMSQQDTWVTIFGFPSEFSKEVVDFFKRIGNPIDIYMKPNCNYISIRYATRYEVHQAVSLNGAMFKPGILLGVLLSSDPDNVGKDIYSSVPNDRLDFKTKLEKLRALSPQSRDTNLDVSQKSTGGGGGGGIVNKAIEYLLRW